MAVDRRLRFGADRPEFVHRITDHVHNAAECSLTNGHHDRPAKIDDLHTADHTVGRQHRYRTNAALAQMLLHLGHNIHGGLNIKTFARDPQSLIDRRQIIIRKFNVNNGADDLDDLSDLLLPVLFNSHY